MARRRLLKGLRASFIAVMVIVISIYMLNLPVTESFFTSQYKTEEPITLTVTTEIKTIGVAFDFGQPAAPMALMMASMSLTVDAIEPTEPASDHIVGIVHFDSGYDMSKVEQRDRKSVV